MLLLQSLEHILRKVHYIKEFDRVMHPIRSCAVVLVLYTHEEVCRVFRVESRSTK